MATNLFSIGSGASRAPNWPGLAIRGFFAILFGLLTFFLPVGTIYAVTLLFGAYAFIGGLMSLAAAIHSSPHGDRLLLIQGVLGVAVAVVTVIWPTVTLIGLIYLMAAWAIIAGGL